VSILTTTIEKYSTTALLKSQNVLYHTENNASNYVNGGGAQAVLILIILSHFKSATDVDDQYDHKCRQGCR